jgi:phosphoglycolate phosphatase
MIGNKYQYILFDLDGTLTDPALGITNSVRYALRYYGIKVENRADLYPFIGPPLKDSFCEYFGFTEEQGIEAVEKYREYFKDKGIFENEVYDGVEDLLNSLKHCGKKVILATSKPQIFAERILKYFNLLQYFDGVVGSELDGRRTDKAEVIDEAIRLYTDGCREKIVMIGDRKYDIMGALKNQIDAVGVSYGYGTAEELKKTGNSAVVGSIDELKNLLLSQ